MNINMLEDINYILLKLFDLNWIKLLADQWLHA